jgi:formylglycine-generating enzyme required for sulfatase activity
MVVVPPGSFMMGSPVSEKLRASDEGPQHRVTIPKAFAVGKYEVTFDEWDACVAAGGCNGYRPKDKLWGRGNRPVIHVSWDDAKAYVNWLSRKTGKRYRLLSESEWEYAARAGTITPFNTGRKITTDQANFDGNYTYGGSAKGENRKKTLPVGSFPANGFGLHDLHGNVWEWVEDCWHESYAGAPSDGSAWTSGGDCGQRVLRGGSSHYEPRVLRSAFRHKSGTSSHYYLSGIRVARTLDR